MFNFIKKLVVTFLTRKVFVVTNRATKEYFIKSHITDDGYISLLTDSGSYLPVKYSVFKKMFEPQAQIDGFAIEGVQYSNVLLTTGAIPLVSLNDQPIEDSLDSDYL